MKSEVHVETKDGKLRSMIESLLADYLWKHPEQFAGKENETLEFKVQIKFGSAPIGHHTSEVS